jgi:ABC-type glutathione transport system ATPase component
MTAALLEATKLAKFYPVKGGALGARLHAVDEVDLVIGAGESVGLVGESGCGKSTMVRLLARLVDPTSGTIALAGRDITDVSQARFVRSRDRARIQVVFQDPTDSLHPSFRVFRAIADPLQRLQATCSQRRAPANCTGCADNQELSQAARLITVRFFA